MFGAVGADQGGAGGVTISVLVLTLNEAANLPACLAAVAWSDDVVVLDSLSQDETVAVAEGLGARVYQRAFDDFAGQRNYALDQIPFKHEGVLHLDADKIVTPALRAELAAAVAGGGWDAWCQWPPELHHFRPRKLTRPEIRISVSFRFSVSVDSFLLRA